MKKAKQGSFIDEIKNIRQNRVNSGRKSFGSQPVSSPDLDQEIRTDFNRRGLKAPAPDKLPKTFSGNLDLDALQKQQKALINGKKP